MTENRSMGYIKNRYQAQRRLILKAIKECEVSSSMSSIEYYPKDWDDLCPTNPQDWHIIETALTWDGEKHCDLGGFKMTDFNINSRPDICPLCGELGLLEMQEENQVGCEECGVICTIKIDHVYKDWIELND